MNGEYLPAKPCPTVRVVAQGLQGHNIPQNKQSRYEDCEQLMAAQMNFSRLQYFLMKSECLPFNNYLSVVTSDEM